jgi:hypothetical protein
MYNDKTLAPCEYRQDSDISDAVKCAMCLRDVAFLAIPDRPGPPFCVSHSLPTAPHHSNRFLYFFGVHLFPKPHGECLSEEAALCTHPPLA